MKKETVQEKQQRMISENIGTIINLNKTGTNLPEICRILNIRYRGAKTLIESSHGYYIIAHSHYKGIKDPSIKKEIDENIDSVISSLETGESLRQICKDLSANYWQMYAAIKERRPEILSRKKNEIHRDRISEAHLKDRPKIQKNELHELYHIEKKTMKEIANLFDVPNNYIRTLIHKYSIPVRSYSERAELVWTEEARERQRKLAYDGIIGIHLQSEGAYRFTQPERAFAKWCDENDVDYTRQYQIQSGTHRYDFLINDVGILVEIDGVYWHSTDEQKELDRKFEEYASDHGYLVIRFTDFEINDTKCKCFERLLQWN
jgi:very-short-patch-repair endonuclease/predicted DNA-binding protein YlxM (UPF0122 family)